jgi:hypothetical protein
MTMEALRYTLLMDGRSDEALIPILNWLLQDLGVKAPIQPECADLTRFQPKTLSKRMKIALDLFPCDLLFVHRDSEAEPRQTRRDEIQRAVNEYRSDSLPSVVEIVPVIPIRMTEAWLLTSEPAIRAAAGNRNGTVPLPMPRIQKLEDLPDPKKVLHDLLRAASEKRGRRLKDLKLYQCASQIPLATTDFSLLRQLAGFRALEADLRRWLRAHEPRFR